MPKTRGEWIAATIVWLAVAAIIVAIVYPACATGGYRPGRTVSTLKVIAIAIQMYSEDHDGCIPMNGTWMDAIDPYLKNDRALMDDSVPNRKEGDYGIAFYGPVSGINVKAVVNPESVPLVFQSSDLRRNASSDLSTLPSPPRDFERNFVAFLDCHAKAMPPEWPTAPVVVIIDPALKEEDRP